MTTAGSCDDWWHSLPLKRREQLYRWFGAEGMTPTAEIEGQQPMFDALDLQPRKQRR